MDKKYLDDYDIRCSEIVIDVKKKIEDLYLPFPILDSINERYPLKVNVLL